MMEVLSNTIIEIAGGGGSHQRAPEYGGRAWKLNGERVDVVYWDVGNGWASIITVISHRGAEAHIQEFWDALLLSNDEKG